MFPSASVLFVTNGATNCLQQLFIRLVSLIKERKYADETTILSVHFLLQCFKQVNTLPLMATFTFNVTIYRNTK